MHAALQYSDVNVIVLEQCINQVIEKVTKLEMSLAIYIVRQNLVIVLKKFNDYTTQGLRLAVGV